MKKKAIHYMDGVVLTKKIQTENKQLEADLCTRTIPIGVWGRVRAVYGDSVTVHFPFVGFEVVETVKKDCLCVESEIES